MNIKKGIIACIFITIFQKVVFCYKTIVILQDPLFCYKRWYIVMIEANVGLIAQREDGSEKVNYQNDDFPSYLHVGYVFPGATWINKPHFHEDLEFITITKGKTGYNVNGEKIYLEAGDTLMVNTNQVHYNFTTQQENCSYYIGILHPSLLCSSYYIQTHFVEPVTHNPNLPYVLIRHDDPFANKIYEDMEDLMDAIDSEISITICFLHLFKHLFSWCRGRSVLNQKAQVSTTDTSFKSMLKFIHTHFAEPISLADIAKEGGVSKTHCNTLFKQYTGNTPMDNLNRYRVERVAYYVSNTNLSMSDIAEKTGFSGASYMTETFKKYYGVAPRAYISQLDTGLGARIV